MRRLLYVNAMMDAPSGEICLDGARAVLGKSFELIPYNLFYGETQDPAAFGDAARRLGVQGIVLSGSEKNTTAKDDPWLQHYYRGLSDVLRWQGDHTSWQGPAVPVFGICFGHQALACVLGGATERKSLKVDVEKIEPTAAAQKFGELKDFALRPQNFIMYHADHVSRLPAGFERVFSSGYCAEQGMRHARFPVLSLQSHPEMSARMKTEGDEPELWAPVSDEALRTHDGPRFLQSLATHFFKSQ